MSMGIPSSAYPYPAANGATGFNNPVRQQTQTMASMAPLAFANPYASPTADTGTGTTTDYLMAALTEANDIATNASQQFHNEILPEGRAWQAQQDALKHQSVGLPAGQGQATPATAPSATANPFTPITPPQRDETMPYLPYYGQAGYTPQVAMPYAQPAPYGTPYNQPNLAGMGAGVTSTDLAALHKFYQEKGLSPQQSMQQIEAQLQSGQPLAPQAVSNNGNIPFRFGLASAGYFAKGVVSPVVDTVKLAMAHPLSFAVGAAGIGFLAKSKLARFLAPPLALLSLGLVGAGIGKFGFRQVTAQNGAERAKAFEDLGFAATSAAGYVWGAPKAYGTLIKAVDGLDDASKVSQFGSLKTAQEFSGLPLIDKFNTLFKASVASTRKAIELALQKDTWANHSWTQAVKQFFSAKGTVAQTADVATDVAKVASDVKQAVKAADVVADTATT